MPDYKEMYATLFRSQTQAISVLQEAQKKTEDMYIEVKPPSVVALPTMKHAKSDGQKHTQGHEGEDAGNDSDNK